MGQLHERTNEDLGIMLGGGGALAAYQVGHLAYLAERFPALHLPIVTGVSAGAVNAAALAGLPGSFAERVAALEAAWCSLNPERVFRVQPLHLGRRVLQFGLRLVSGRRSVVPRPRSLLDTAPLRAFLQDLLGGPEGELRGLAANQAAGEVRAVAVTASSYASGKSVTWVSDHEAGTWVRAHRVSKPARLGIEHVMASGALPLLFPAVAVDGEWYGDGGMALTAPFSPAIHLGASRVLSIATRHLSAAVPPDVVQPYPPPAQVAGAVLSALFLEHSEGDALRVERINRLLRSVPPAERLGMRQVDLLVLRPSVDLGKLANAYEARLPRTLRYLIQGTGSREGKGNELLSLLMFQTDYLRRLIDIGRADAAERADEIAAFVTGAGRG